MKITKDEYEIMKTEIAERLRDAVYSDAELQVDSMFRKSRLRRNIPDKWPDGDKLVFTFSVDMLVGDLRQIVARPRRTSNNQEPIAQAGKEGKGGMV